MSTLRFVSMTFVAALVACTQTNQDHCANRDGDRTCAQQDEGSHPVCSRCESANNGCVEASVELEGSCHAETVADTSTSNGSSPTTDDTMSASQSSTTMTTDDTMTTDPVTTMTTDPVTTMTTDPVTTMTTSEDTTTSVSTTQGTETSEGETTSSSTDPSETMESSTTMTDGGPCPNGMIDEGEQCDSDDLQGETCESQGLGAGTLECAPTCQLDASDCLPAPGCGDGIINGDEVCDENDLGFTECADLNPAYGEGTLTCNGNCTYDTTDCCVAGGQPCNGSTNCCGSCVALLCL